MVLNGYFLNLYSNFLLFLCYYDTWHVLDFHLFSGCIGFCFSSNFWTFFGVTHIMGKIVCLVCWIDHWSFVYNVCYLLGSVTIWLHWTLISLVHCCPVFFFFNMLGGRTVLAHMHLLHLKRALLELFSFSKKKKKTVRWQPSWHVVYELAIHGI